MNMPCSCMNAHTHTHTNQYAEPEPLHSLITASFTAASGFNTSCLFLHLKCPEKREESVQMCLKSCLSNYIYNLDLEKILRRRQNYLFLSLLITVFSTYSFIVCKVKKSCWCSVVCGHENRAAAIHRPKKWSKSNFTCQDLRRDYDLYHLFNTSTQKSLHNHKPLAGTEDLIMFESSSSATLPLNFSGSRASTNCNSHVSSLDPIIANFRVFDFSPHSLSDKLTFTIQETLLARLQFCFPH